MSKCPSCDYEHDNLISLSVHFRKKHKGTAKQLRIELFHEGVEPTCACGCGEPVKFHAIQMGFAEYVHGHHARVHNNWGHNKEALLKSQDVRREQIAAGEWKPWNLGETKETDERVASYGRNGSHTLKSDPDCQKQRSEHMSDQWKSGSITPLTGSSHGRWKGGVSSVQALSRSYVFNVWTYPKLHASGFTCQECGSKERLEVHHDKKRFAEILQKARDVLGDVTEDFSTHQAYAKWVADYHVNNDVSGIVLCETCHERAHSLP